MKTAIKHTLMGLLALASLQSHAEDFISDGLRYKTYGRYGEVIVAKNESAKGDIEIPSEITYNGKTYPVTSIGNSAFAYCNEITSITIPNSVRSIRNYAFYDCPALVSVTIPNSVTTIESAAFYDCSGLTSVTIPNSVTTIAHWMFYNCSGLTSVTIPNSVTTIEEEAFSNCSGLASITIPNTVTTIGQGAFSYCSGLTSITIPNSAPSIGYSAFYGCTGLTSVTIPNSVTEIWAFFECTSLKSIYMQCEEPIPARFQPEVCNEATLYVPIGTSDAYKNSNYWKDFKNIQEMDFSGISGTITDNNGTMQISVNKGTLTINGIDNCGSITIYDMQGRIAYTGTSHTIEHLLPGLYIVKAGSQIAKVSI